MTFGYTSTEPVLRDFALTVAPGETVALVGSSGFGQVDRRRCCCRGSTTCTTGASRSTASTCATSRCTRCGAASASCSRTRSSSPTRSPPTSRSAGPTRPQEEIEAAARAAEAHEFILRLPDGYDTVVGEQGLTLSRRSAAAHRAGARAALGPADPPARRRDLVGRRRAIEEEIHATLRRIASTRTTILIAHRRSTLSLADRIVVVDKGRVLDTGTNEELWERCRALPHAALRSGRRRRRDRREPRSRRRRRPGRRHHARGVARASTTTNCASAQIAEPRPDREPDRGGARRRRRRRRRHGRRAAWAARSRRRPSCSRRSTRCRPPTPIPTSTSRSRAGRAPDFKFLRFLQRYRGWLLVGLAARRARRAVHARRPVARALRHRPRRRRRSPRRRCIAASLRVPRDHALRLVGDVGRRARHGPHLGAAAARAADQGVRPPPAARRRLLRARDGRAGS